MNNSFRDYDPDRDSETIKRIWFECGWIKDLETDGKYVKDYFAAAERAMVADINGDAECAVQSSKGCIQYQNESLSMSAVTAVTTSRISRKLGFAKELTAELVVRQALDGYALSSLGMFEQGFYDQLGFGTGSYEHWIKFDPATLIVASSTRAPSRLKVKDASAMHSSLCNRSKTHGSVSLSSPLYYKTEMHMTENGFGLGFYEGPELTHFFWGKSEGENGPLVITYIAYQNASQFLELMSLLKALGDQINQVVMLEPGHIQLQDLLRQPFRSRRSTSKGQFSHESRTMAYWQIRILDLQKCIANTNLNTPDLSFNLQLSDPIENCLDDEAQWRGIGGEYTIKLGQRSTVRSGHHDDLPLLKATVNEFTRMWFGIRSASELAMTTSLQGEQELLNLLDASLNLPRPHPGWDY
ncbi:MAG: putative acetyltransferase [Candidatus Azotimanducaceae bacterium]|jgi:predicted acetyltransferase